MAPARISEIPQNTNSQHWLLHLSSGRNGGAIFLLDYDSKRLKDQSVCASRPELNICTDHMVIWMQNLVLLALLNDGRKNGHLLRALRCDS